ncbi:glycosyltransferase family 2 protein [Agromyces laixinhei]|uniref:glycosyltransferase family 2 protein n=1 Tax=Agromyces laixinhei TaxID=2585717 RepID=UPI0012EE41FB|nr:glycosyltransferase family 2 protein [Agromyces laixinhei]
MTGSERASPTISVALGTHNGAVFLTEQLESILAQSRPVDEIVISDDASTDGTLELAKRVIAARGAGGPAPALVALSNPTALGVTANFERALRAASGDLVVLCDQDDIWHVDRIAIAVEHFLERPELDLVHADARLVDGDGAPLGSTLFETLYVSDAELAAERDGRAFEVLMRRNVVTGATTMLTARLVARAQPFPDSWVHDEWLAMIAAIGGGVVAVERPLIDYRQHGGNQIGAESLGIAGKLGRLRTPRTARNARLLARAEDLAQRMRTIQPRPSDERRAAVSEKLAHERVRHAYPAARLRRIPPVLREVRTGRYRRFGLGVQDVVRDLVQPV